MRVFVLFELVIICGFLYLVVNLVRYFFFKESNGGRLFGLSDRWIKGNERRKK